MLRNKVLKSLDFQTPIVTMTTYFNYPSPALQKELKEIAQAIVAPGKGAYTISLIRVFRLIVIS